MNHGELSLFFSRLIRSKVSKQATDMNSKPRLDLTTAPNAAQCGVCKVLFLLPDASILIRFLPRSRIHRVDPGAVVVNGKVVLIEVTATPNEFGSEARPKHSNASAAGGELHIVDPGTSLPSTLQRVTAFR